MAADPLEIWGGLECTINRVHDDYFNQLHRNGHQHRILDLDLFAGLGIRALRYPILWEQFAPNENESIDWTWADVRLNRLRELGVQPIVGFVHHGSGPRHTSLTNPSFVTGLARFARDFAERFPWIERYTPVNEPLTTARFSCLYGHWYPHGRSMDLMIQATLIQCEAIRAAMREVRRVNSTAQFISTEDLGRIYASPPVAAQAEFENERRWLSYDLLTGTLTRERLMWDHVLGAGIAEERLQSFIVNPCPPTIMGINHYLTSDRYLDHDLERYSDQPIAHVNGIAYADIEAVRALDVPMGVCHRLQEAWDRYHLPLAVTESHLGCTREEQCRWLYEAWTSSQQLRENGVDVRAVTAWSLLGAYDWNRLLVANFGHYETGVFDVRNGDRRPTALARLIKDLATGGCPAHPVLKQPGWWHREDRFFYPLAEGRTFYVGDTPASDMEDKYGQPLAIVGVRGTLGSAFTRLCDLRGIPYDAVTRDEMDISDPVSVEAYVARVRPWAIINCAGYVRVDDAENDRDGCFKANVIGPTSLAAACARHNVRLVNFSSDLVFDGKKGSPYVESDAPNPLNVYGESKAEMERRVLAIDSSSLIIRTSAFFGPWDDYNFATRLVKMLAAGENVVAAWDLIVTPTYVVDLVHATLDALIDESSGIWHLANQDPLSWVEFAHLIAKTVGVDHHRLIPTSSKNLGLVAERPRMSALTSERGILLLGLDDAVHRFARHRRVAQVAQPSTNRFSPWSYRHGDGWA